MKFCEVLVIEYSIKRFFQIEAAGDRYLLTNGVNKALPCAVIMREALHHKPV